MDNNYSIFKLKTVRIILFFAVSFVFVFCSRKTDKDEISFKDTATPVPDTTVLSDVPAWSKYSKMFMYAPTFDFDVMEKAEKYKYKLLASDGKIFSFEAQKPNLPLSPVWEKIPEGTVFLNIIALNKAGDSIGLAGSRRFYRSIPFQGVTNTPKQPYKDAAYNALEYIFNLPYIQSWLTSTEPDLNYIYYAYPAKTISATMNVMLQYSENKSTSKEDSLKAMIIALNMANYLESLASSKHSLLKVFPVTYNVEFINQRLKDTVKYPVSFVYDVVNTNANKMMMLYGYEYANRLLKLYDFTNDKKWLDIVKSIAESYKDLQLDDGSWYLNIDYNSGEPLNESKMIPGILLLFYKKLELEYGISGYQDVIDKADKWIRENPLKTYFWEGQFEDVPSFEEPYKNLSKYPATEYAIYLLRYVPTKNNIAIAKELIRFAEDQFVIWGRPPCDTTIFESSEFHTPSVMEQYNYFVPVDASAAQMIKTYIEAYSVTKEKVYFHKAETLANSITEQQTNDGKIYTIWYNEDPMQQDWLDCMLESIDALILFEHTKNERFN